MSKHFDDFLEDFNAGGGGSGGGGTDDGQSLIGQQLFDPNTGQYLGQFVHVSSLSQSQRLAFVQVVGSPGLSRNVAFLGPNNQPAAPPTDTFLIPSLGGFAFVRLDLSGNVLDERRATQSDISRLGLDSGGTSTGGGRAVRQSQLLTQAEFDQQIALLEEQARIARETGDQAREAQALQDIEFLKQQQEFATGEREASQEFAAGQSELSRENAIRLQLLQEVSATRRQVLDLQARGRELKASIIGKDAFRSAALAQGLTPTRGTPADLLGDELNTLIRRPVPQPQSFSIEDIQATLGELAGTAAQGVPSGQGFGLARGGVIDMRKDKDGVFSPTVRSMKHGGSARRPRRSEELQVLVGEEGPELMTVTEDEIRISPVATAAHGLSISRPRFGGRRLSPVRRSGGRGAPSPLENIDTDAPLGDALDKLSGLPQPISPTTPPGVRPPEPDPGPIIRPIVGPGPNVPPLLSPVPVPQPVTPDFEPSPTAITQALASVFAHLGFADSGIPTFREGEFGGMQIPAGGLSVFDRLGVSPSLIRIKSGPGTVRNFFISPSGELQLISEGGLLSQNLGLQGSGFRTEDFLTVDPSDLLRAGFSLNDILGPNPTPFTGQDILANVSQTPFPLRRSPIGINFGDIFQELNPGADPADSPFGPGGIFLPSPRTLSNFYRTADPATQAALLSAWTLDFFTEDQVFRELDFFRPQGSFSPAQTARLR